MVSKLVWTFNRGAFTTDQNFFCNCTSFQRLILLPVTGVIAPQPTTFLCSQNPDDPTQENPSLIDFAHALTCRQQQDLRRCISPYGKRMRQFSISIFADLLFLGVVWLNPTRSIQVPASSNNIQPLQFPASSCFSFNSVSSYWKSVRAYKSQHFLDN